MNANQSLAIWLAQFRQLLAKARCAVADSVAHSYYAAHLDPDTAALRCLHELWVDLDEDE